MSDKHPITLGHHPWGKPIIPNCIFLEDALNEEHVEVPVNEEMAESLWTLIAMRTLDFKVSWGKPTIFSNEKYYIEVGATRFIFIIEEEDIKTFKRAKIEVELTRKEIFEKLRAI